MASPIENPFFRASDLPYQLPPFDQITEEHYAPAFTQALSEHRAELAAIATNPEPATFENTMVALERAGAALRQVEAVFNNVVSADGTPALRAVEEEFAPKLAAHRDAIYLDRRLFARVRALYEAREQLALDPESAWLLERYHTAFVRAGALLDPADQERLKEINQQLSGLLSQFRNALLADTNELAVAVEERAALAGLADDAIEAAAQAAQDRGAEGYLLTLVLPTNQPALAALRDRALRERLLRAATSRGSRGNDHDTGELIKTLVRLRAQRAELLGYPHHAAYQIEDRTAGTLAAVEEMLGQLTSAAVANAEAEAAALRKTIEAGGGEFGLQAWDWAYYTEQVRKRDYDLDLDALRPYFPLPQVLRDGVFFAAEQLYGLTFTERTDLPTPHPQARIFEVFDADGSPRGLFVADLFTRDSKRGGAWQSSFVPQSRLLATEAVSVVHMNISRPPAGETALLTADEVSTLFHEFGHALHTLLSDVNYPRFAGTSVPRDFVEYPSQVNEVWMLWPEVLANYARHHRTGAPLPGEVADNLRAAQKFNTGFATTEILAASLLDLAWHRLSAAQAEAVTDVDRFEAEALAAAGVAVATVPPRYRSHYFAHVFSTEGYSAGYYSYLWSEVLDADTVEWFTQRGGLTRESGEWFRRKLLARGGSIDPMVAFREFRGRDPQLEPLLLRRGLR